MEEVMHTSMQNTLLQNAHVATKQTTQLSSGGCAFSCHQNWITLYQLYS